MGYLLTVFSILKNVDWKKYGKYVGLIISHGVLIIGLLYFAYMYYTTEQEFNQYQTFVAQKEKNISDENLRIQKENTKLINEYEERLNQLYKEQQQTEKKIKELVDEAVKSDGDGFSGIGPSSLQLYNRALGYN